MKKFSFFFILLFLSQLGFSKSEETIPELEKKLSEATTDSVKLFCHKELCKRYRDSNLEKLKYHTDAGMPLANLIKDSLMIGFFHVNYGTFYLKKSNQDSSFFHFKEAIRLQELSGNKKGIISSKSTYADALMINGFIEEGIKIYYEIIETCEKEGYYDGLISCYFGIANSLQLQKEHKRSLEYIKKAEPICDKIEERRQPSCRSVVLSNFAGIYFYLEDYDKSIEYGIRAAALKKEANYIGTLNHTYNLIGDSYLKKGDKENTLLYFKKAYDISEKLKITTGTIKAANKLIKTHLEFKDIKPVGELLQLQEKRIAKTKNKILLAEYYRLSSIYYSRIEDYKKTSFFYKNYVEIKDTIFLKEKNQAILELETKYETENLKKEKKQAEIKEQLSNKLATKNKRLFITTLTTAILLLLTSIFFFFQLKMKKRAEIAELKLSEAENKLEMERRINQVEKEKIESELKALRSQMNPHFIFNSLNSIQDLILREETDKSYDYIVLFADLVRSTLNHSNEKFITIDKEMEFLDVYLNLEKLRFKDNFNYKINYEGTKDIKIPSLIIQPFIENSLLHGLLHKKGEKNIDINFELINDMLSCTITDNGVGRKRAKQIRERQQPNHKSFAMDAIKKRLEFLSEQHNINASYEINDLYEENIATGTQVIIKMPFKEMY